MERKISDEAHLSIYGQVSQLYHINECNKDFNRHGKTKEKDLSHAYGLDLILSNNKISSRIVFCYEETNEFWVFHTES